MAGSQNMFNLPLDAFDVTPSGAVVIRDQHIAQALEQFRAAAAAKMGPQHPIDPAGAVKIGVVIEIG